MKNYPVVPCRTEFGRVKNVITVCFKNDKVDFYVGIHSKFIIIKAELYESEIFMGSTWYFDNNHTFDILVIYK